ncbi:hypothetical protein [Rhodopseudomonas palustris]|nr:hypothetical protein [Rhodopseudomonas palustris]
MVIIEALEYWIPACAGMTWGEVFAHEARLARAVACGDARNDEYH